MKRQKQNRLYRPRMESLETRNLLAGDVAVSVADNGALLIEGDELSNGVLIEAGANPGEYVVTGQPTDDGDTTVNSVVSVTVGGVTRGVHVRMGAGDDIVEGDGLRVRGNLTIGMGTGDDTLSLSDVDVRRTLRVALREGADSASLDDVRVSGRAGVAGGVGADVIDITNTRVERRLAVSGGQGDDTVRVSDSSAAALSLAARHGDNVISVTDTHVRRLTSVLTGRGNDTISSLNTQPAAGDEGGDSPQAHWGGLQIVDHGGDNAIELANLAIGRGGLRIRTANGVDHARIADCRIRGATTIATGGEADEVAITDAVFGGSVLVRMGAGDDVLRVGGSTFHGRTVAAGGPGIDTFFSRENDFVGPLFENFELPAEETA